VLASWCGVARAFQQRRSLHSSRRFKSADRPRLRLALTCSPESGTGFMGLRADVALSVSSRVCVFCMIWTTVSTETGRDPTRRGRRGSTCRGVGLNRGYARAARLEAETAGPRCVAHECRSPRIVSAPIQVVIRRSGDRRQCSTSRFRVVFLPPIPRKGPPRVRASEFFDPRSCPLPCDFTQIVSTSVRLRQSTTCLHCGPW
jgi:hypothetical protein